MKTKQKHLGIMLFLKLFVLSTICLTTISCGGDDNSTEKIVDGVSVRKGKKMKYVSKTAYDSSGRRRFIYEFYMSYDSKGRLTKIESQEDNIPLEYIIDYDKKEITVLKKNKMLIEYNFALNNEGYISLMDLKDAQSQNNGNLRYELDYDSDGHLILSKRIEENEDKAETPYNYLYSDGNLIKRWLNYDDFTYRYSEYENIGSLMFQTKLGIWWGDKLNPDIVFLEAGLFGKVSKKIVSQVKEDTYIYDYKYQFDDDGYVTFAEVSERYYSSTKSDTSEYYFVWE